MVHAILELQAKNCIPDTDIDTIFSNHHHVGGRSGPNACSKANEASIAFHCNQLLRSKGGDVVLICNTPLCTNVEHD
jgi:hypothetical protein